MNKLRMPISSLIQSLGIALLCQISDKYEQPDSY